MNSQKKIHIGAIITFWVIAISILGRIAWVKHDTTKEMRQILWWKDHVWPAEREKTREYVRSRALVNETKDAVTINLTPYINAKLTDAPLCWKGNNTDNLSELPAGTNIYAGVPFDVEGSIQLMGSWMEHYGKKYPAKVENIAIKRKCSKIHILHAASYVQLDDTGTTVAKLVIHYTDGTSKDIPLVAGAQVFDWWHPLFTTDMDKRMTNAAPGTELAWTGSNQYIKEHSPVLDLSLYKTTLDNPESGTEISTVDYISTLTHSCPFLVALTVE